MPAMYLGRPFCVLFAVLLATAALRAEDAALRADDKAASVPAEDTDRLAVEQSKVADSYARFKKNLTDLAALIKETDPARSATLEKAVQEMNRAGTGETLEQLVELLGSESLLLRDVDDALRQQESVETQLMALLKLLLTENRAKKTENERTRIRKYIKVLKRYRNIQSGLEGQSRRSDEPQDLAPRQGSLAKKTQGIADDIKDREETTDKPADSEEGDESVPGDKEPGDKEPGDKEPDAKEEEKKESDNPADKPTDNGNSEGEGQGQGQGEGEGQGQG
ncbi:MAG TPA: hypothetical protein VMX74_03885, partial [Pirellulales bacterium]|nr:hypothetical protein [Pirellulales bacterium]